MFAKGQAMSGGSLKDALAGAQPVLVDISAHGDWRLMQAH